MGHHQLRVARPPHVDLSKSEIGCVADRLHAVVQEKGTRKAAGAEVGISSQHVSGFLNRPGAMSVAPDVLDALARYFGVSQVVLLTVPLLTREQRQDLVVKQTQRGLGWKEAP